MDKKWHKNCGGKVVYQKPIEEGVGFKQVGFCKKCEDFPIVEEDIIFHVNGMLYERFYETPYESSWRITTKSRLKEVLE